MFGLVEEDTTVADIRQALSVAVNEAIEIGPDLKESDRDTLHDLIVKAVDVVLAQYLPGLSQLVERDDDTLS
jgi:hypothetical protein